MQKLGEAINEASARCFSVSTSYAFAAWNMGGGGVDFRVVPNSECDSGMISKRHQSIQGVQS